MEFCADFPQMFLRGFGASKKEFQSYAKICTNLRRSNSLSGEGSLLHLGGLEQTACHTKAAKPKHSRRACGVHYGTLGPKRKSLLAFASVQISQKSALRPTSL